MGYVYLSNDYFLYVERCGRRHFQICWKKGECIGHALLMALRIQLYSAVQRCIVYSYTSLNTIQHAIQPLQYTPLCSDSAECAVSLIKLAELT